MKATTELRTNIAAAAWAFSTYFCMYAFRKPFAAVGYGSTAFGLDWKTVFVLAQLLGYTTSKYVGIRLVSEMARRDRKVWLVGLIAVAWIALLGFAALPIALKPVAMGLNGLCLGMVWGLVVRYLEGRRASDLLFAALSCSFIVASGVVKDVGRWLITDFGVADFWMPLATGLVFVGPFVLSVLLLDRTPEPSDRDQSRREVRQPMGAAQRRAFFLRQWAGLLPLLVAYLGLTAFRDFRDNYGAELFTALGYGEDPGLFTRTEVPIAFSVLLIMAALGTAQGRISGLVATFCVMLAGLALIGLSTLGLQAQVLSGQTWMILSGLGAYMAYVPFSSFVFDRIMAATRTAGTAVFAVNLFDAVGYSGSVAVQLFKDLGAADVSRLSYMIGGSLGLAVIGLVLLLIGLRHFLAAARVPHSSMAIEPSR